MSENDRFEKLYEDQLTFLKDLYSNIDEKSNNVLEKAEIILDKAGNAEDEMKGYIKKCAGYVGTMIVILVAFLSFFGIKTWIDVDRKIKLIEDTATTIKEHAKEAEEFKTLSKEYYDKSKNYFGNLKSTDEKSKEILLALQNRERDSLILKEIMLKIKNIAHDAGLGRNINFKSYDELKDASMRCRMTMVDLTRDYLDKYRTTDYKVIMAAINTYLELVQHASIELYSEEIIQLIKASLYVLEKSSFDEWRLQVKCRNNISILINNLQSINMASYNRQIIELRYLAIDSDSNVKFRWNLTMILFNLGKAKREEIEFLTEFLSEVFSNQIDLNRRQKPWVICLSSAALIESNELEGWAYMTKVFNSGGDYEKDTSSYILALLGKRKLLEYGIEENWKIGTIESKLDFLTANINRTKDQLRDKYSKAFYSMLLNNLQNS